MLHATYRFVLGLLIGAILGTVIAKTSGRRTRKTFVVDRAVLPDAIPHVVYEYSNLVHSGDYVANKSPGGPIGVHVGDVFLLNCRKLGDFFSTRPTDKPDVRAVHFCTKDPMPIPAMQHYRKWKAAMDQNLAHISYKRVTNPIVFYDGKDDRNRVTALTEEIRTAFRLFLDHIDDEYKPAFSTELNKRRPAVDNIPLP
jgi:hypothetical protein